MNHEAKRESICDLLKVQKPISGVRKVKENS